LHLAVAGAVLASGARAADKVSLACIQASDEGQTSRDAGNLLQARELFAQCAVAKCPSLIRRDCTAWLEQVQLQIPSVVFGAHDAAGRDVLDSKVTIDGQALEKQFEQTRGAYAHQLFTDLAEAERKVGGLTQDLVKAERKASEQVLRAPLDGTVQQLAIHTVGGVVSAAQQLMLVVPTDSVLEAEAMVSNRDIGFVNDGQQAEVKIDTFNFTRYGLIGGKVVSVSRDAIVKDKPQDPSLRAKGNGALSDSSEPAGQELVYSARIALDRTDMQIDNKVVPLSPGMAVTVEIKTGSRRLIEYLLSPVMRYRHESLRER